MALRVAMDLVGQRAEKAIPITSDLLHTATDFTQLHIEGFDAMGRHLIPHPFAFFLKFHFRCSFFLFSLLLLKIFSTTSTFGPPFASLASFVFTFAHYA
jgi:hypothetical protein